MLKKIDHIGIAVKNLEEALKFYEGILGLKATKFEVVEHEKVKIAFLPVGNVNLELLQSTEPDGPINKFIWSRGEGVHHIAFKVENIDKTLQFLKEKGEFLIDKEARLGAGGAKIAFLHPKSTFGILLELCKK